MKCQIGYPELREKLICKHVDSGGVQCERTGMYVTDPEHRHWVSEHTIRHSIIGNGYACESVTS